MDATVMTLEEAQRRDQVLRSYLVGRDWGLDAEQQLVRHLVLHSKVLLPRWPILVGYEWGPPGGTRGDLLFYDGKVSFAAVEIKSLAKKANKKRNEVEIQAMDSAKRVQSALSEASVTALVYTDDEHQEGSPPRAPGSRRTY